MATTITATEELSISVGRNELTSIQTPPTAVTQIDLYADFNGILNDTSRDGGRLRVPHIGDSTDINGDPTLQGTQVDGLNTIPQQTAVTNTLAAIKAGRPKQAAIYIPRVQDFERRCELFQEIGYWPEASAIAFKLKDFDRVMHILKHCDDPTVQRSCEEFLSSNR